MTNRGETGAEMHENFIKREFLCFSDIGPSKKIAQLIQLRF